MRHCSFKFSCKVKKKSGAFGGSAFEIPTWKENFIVVNLFLENNQINSFYWRTESCFEGVG